MKIVNILALMLLLLVVSCSHNKTKSMEEGRETVTFSENGKTYVGTLFRPKAEVANPALVLVVHEWWGKNEYALKRGQMLADAGYAALVVDLYGDNQRADEPTGAQALATPFYQNPQTAIDLLNKYLHLAKGLSGINQEKTFAIGYCFGGTQVLNLARSGAALSGVASFHGGLKSGVKKAKKVPAKILVLNGAADPMVPAAEIKEFKKEFKSHKSNLIFVDYPGALHAFTNPQATEVGKKYNLPVAYDEKADLDSWQKLLTFLQ